MQIGMTKEEAEDELENLWNADPMNDPDIDNDSDDEDEAFGNVHLNDTEQSESKAFGPLVRDFWSILTIVIGRKYYKHEPHTRISAYSGKRHWLKK